MSEALSTRELESLPEGALVVDFEQDVYRKNAFTMWDQVHAASDSNVIDVSSPTLSLWSPRLLREDSGPYTAERILPDEQDATVEGVWIVWDSTSKTSINGLFPADGEINALRMVNRNGYGHAEFTPFGEV